MLVSKVDICSINWKKKMRKKAIRCVFEDDDKIKNQTKAELKSKETA